MELLTTSRKGMKDLENEIENVRRHTHFLPHDVIGPDHDALSCAAKKQDKTDTSTNRIVGGNFADFAPYQIIFVYKMKKPKGRVRSCGGTILNKRFILTALHCVKKENVILSPETAIMKVMVGELDWCKATGQDSRRAIINSTLESVKDVSEVIAYESEPLSTWPELFFGLPPKDDLAILKVDLFFVWIRDMGRRQKNVSFRNIS